MASLTPPPNRAWYVGDQEGDNHCTSPDRLTYTVGATHHFSGLRGHTFRSAPTLPVLRGSVWLCTISSTPRPGLKVPLPSYTRTSYTSYVATLSGTHNLFGGHLEREFFDSD